MTYRSFFIRCLAAAAVCATAFAGLSSAAYAEPIAIEGKNFASVSDYLIGDWKWERQEPMQTVFMRFNRDGSFLYRNEAVKLEHTGRFTTSSNGIEVTILRTCNPQCTGRNPPTVLPYPLVPQTLNYFRSADEEWYRVTGQ